MPCFQSNSVYSSLFAMEETESKVFNPRKSFRSTFQETVYQAWFSTLQVGGSWMGNQNMMHLYPLDKFLFVVYFEELWFKRTPIPKLQQSLSHFNLQCVLI